MKSKRVTINRDVNEQSKGFRLQRLRAVSLMIQAVNKHDLINAFCATELGDDVCLSEATTTSETEYKEQNKDVPSAGTVSFNREIVLKSMVNFIDCWFDQRLGSESIFGFYATVPVCKETHGGKVKDLNITLPHKSIIELLTSKDFEADHLLPAVKALVLDEYKRQYGKRDERGNLIMIGNLDALLTWEDKDWCRFLSQVEWKVGSEDTVAYEKVVLREIEYCPWFDSGLEGRAEIVLACLMDMFERKQLARTFARRFVHASDVRLAFKIVAAGDYRLPDPTWLEWKKLVPDDKRTLASKLQGACSKISTQTVARYARRATASLAEQKLHESDKGLLSLKYQIYDCCEEFLSRLTTKPDISEEEIHKAIEELFECARKRVTNRMQQYCYPLSSENSINDLVLDLFSGCYLTFKNEIR